MMNTTQASDHVFVLACAALVAHIKVVEQGRRDYELFSSPTTIFLGNIIDSEHYPALFHWKYFTSFCSGNGLSLFT
jgi:hypothetical protein